LSLKLKTQKSRLNKKADSASFRSKTIKFKSYLLFSGSEIETTDISKEFVVSVRETFTAEDGNALKLMGSA
jgi:predicted DNA-binding transcriptional regulator